MALRATIGFAFGDGDEGVAYVLLRGPGVERVSRITVPLRMRPALAGRDGGYAALLAVARAVRAQNVRRVIFEIADEHLVNDLAEHGPVPAALAMPYVLLGCALNRFESVAVQIADDSACRDLTARAKADVSLHVAA